MNVKRAGQRLFIVLTVFVMVVQSIPDQSGRDFTGTDFTGAGREIRGLGESRFLGERVQSYLDCVGLWQRPWTLFAPDPRTDFGWLSAEIITSDGSSTRWTSPFWSELGVYDKFIGFRSLNYYGRFRDPLIQSVSDDLADYLSRNESPHSVTSRVELSLSVLEILPNEDEPYPDRDETITMLATKPLTVREYLAPLAK